MLTNLLLIVNITAFSHLYEAEASISCLATMYLLRSSNTRLQLQPNDNIGYLFTPQSTYTLCLKKPDHCH